MTAGKIAESFNKPSVLILVVLYQCDPLESETLVSLAESIKERQNYSVLVWDNSRTDHAENIVTTHFGFQYDGVPDNLSLSKVYNTVIKKYFAHDLLIIFDQDSELSESYFDEVEQIWSTKTYQRSMVYVPQVYCGEELISPGRRFIVKGHAQNKWTAGPFVSKKILAITSGIVISKQCLEMLAGKQGSVFDDRLNLYSIDSKFFIDYGETGFDVYVMESAMQHDSALSAAGGITVERLENLIYSWMIIYSSGIVNKLLVRLYGLYFILKQVVKYRRPGYMRALRTLIKHTPGRGCASS